MWTEIKRKIFHLGSLVYVLGLIYIPRPTYVAILCVALVLVYIGERMRMSRPAWGAFIQRIFGGLMRPREQTQFSGVFWMLLGVTITAAVVKPVPVATTALLYLILGDAAASLIGIRLKGPHWPRGDKRISGSLACLAICLLIGKILLRPDYGWHGIVAGAVTATVVETGLIPIDDNVTIPVASSVVLMLSYGLIPGF